MTAPLCVELLLDTDTLTHEGAMPLLTICKYPGCCRPVPVGERYCVVHKAKGEARDAKAKSDREQYRQSRKGSSSERGYGYRWQKLRARFLAQHPVCAECLKEGRITMATDVDHIRPHKGEPELMWNEGNLQALCHACHSRKTAREDGGFGNRSNE